MNKIAHYIAGFPPNTQERLKEIRSAIKKAAPEAEEVLSYGMPAYKQNGILVYFAGHTNHIGFYPMAKVIVKFKEDIGAMIIQAMLGRGRKKDFWDLFELLKHYSLEQLITFHQKKYPNQMLAISIPNAITYFVDAEDSETPVSRFSGSGNSIPLLKPSLTPCLLTNHILPHNYC